MEKKQIESLRYALSLTSFVLFVCVFSAGIWLYFLISDPGIQQSAVTHHEAESRPDTKLKLIETPRTLQAKELTDKAFTSVKNQTKPAKELGPLPTSLLGSSHGTTLSMTENGDLLVDKDVRDFFEFYLSAIDQEALDTIIMRIHLDMSEQLSGDALEQGNELLRNYIDYKIGLAELEENTPNSNAHFDIAALKRRQEAINSLQEEFLGKDVAEVFFRQDNMYDHYMLSRLAVIQDKSLSAEERSQALSEVELLLPEEKRAKRAHSTQHLRLSSAVETLRKSGASENEVYQLRVSTVGPDAANKLAKLDEERALWRQRLKEYVTERDLIKSSGLSPQEQTLAVNSLIDRRFQGRERIRVRALDPELFAEKL